MDRRRFLLTSLAGALNTPIVVQAQQVGKVARIGFLGGASASGYARHLAALREGLHDLGYDEGRNIIIEYRWAEGKYDRLPSLAAEMVRLQVDVIVTQGVPAAWAAKNATRTIPIVMAISGDAVATGLVISIARPGGNITGSTFFLPELLVQAATLPRAATHSTRDQPGGVSIQRAQDFKFPKSSGLSATIGHHWQQSQVLVRPVTSHCDRSRPMVADTSSTVLTQSSTPFTVSANN